MTPEQERQVDECALLVLRGKSETQLRDKGYAEGAIREGVRRAAQIEAGGGGNVSDNVVTLPTTSPVIWICWCGCSTFELHASGAAHCASCGIEVVGAGGWYMPPRDEVWDGDAPFQDVQGNGSTDFARRRIADQAQAEDVVALVVVRANGGVSTWGANSTPEDLPWLRRRFADAMRLFAGLVH